MQKYHILPPRRKRKPFYTTKSVKETKYTNIIKDIKVSYPSQIWCADFTYIKYDSKFIYLSTIEDKYTREIVSSDISSRHNASLVIKTLLEAFEGHTAPQTFHTDQGSEYMSENVTKLLENRNIQISVSEKGSPWQNGSQESFFSRFKEEFGDFNRFEFLGELIEEIYAYISYYNKYRIHTVLKTSPLKFRQKFLDNCLEKRGP